MIVATKAATVRPKKTAVVIKSAITTKVKMPNTAVRMDSTARCCIIHIGG